MLASTSRSTPRNTRGTLILVIGPSGAGKDTLIAEARTQLAGETRIAFARRFITRPSGSTGEDHLPVTETEFEQLRRSSKLALDWQAHGLSYALSISVLDELAAGRHVIANVSRTIVSKARRLYSPVMCILIDAPQELRAERLGARNRESAEQVAERLACYDGEDFGTADYEVRNDGAIDAGIERFLEAIQSASGIKAHG